jgi:hypothetical protein
MVPPDNIVVVPESMLPLAGFCQSLGSVARVDVPAREIVNYPPLGQNGQNRHTKDQGALPFRVNQLS